MQKLILFLCIAAAGLVVAWTWPSSADVRGTVGSPTTEQAAPTNTGGRMPVQANTAPKQAAPPQVRMKNSAPANIPVQKSVQPVKQQVQPVQQAQPARQVQPVQPARSMQPAARADTRSVMSPMSVVFSPRKIATLSAEVTSTVKKIYKEFGESFTPGETLILLDPSLYKAGLKQAEASRAAAGSELARASKLYSTKAQVKRAEAVLTAAEIEYEAKAKLFKSRSASKSQMEKARRDLLVARENVVIAKAELLPALQIAKKDVAVSEVMIETAKIEMNACNVTAPYKGRVEQVLVNENELVEAGRPLIRIIDDSVLLAKFLAPSNAVTVIKPGMGVSVDVNELGRTVSGKVSHVSAVLDPASNTFEVFAEIPNPDGTLKSGMTGRVRQ